MPLGYYHTLFCYIPKLFGNEVLRWYFSQISFVKEIMNLDFLVELGFNKYNKLATYRVIKTKSLKQGVISRSEK